MRHHISKFNTHQPTELCPQWMWKYCAHQQNFANAHQHCILKIFCPPKEKNLSKHSLPNVKCPPIFGNQMPTELHQMRKKRSPQEKICEKLWPAISNAQPLFEIKYPPTKVSTSLIFLLTKEWFHKCYWLRSWFHCTYLIRCKVKK